MDKFETLKLITFMEESADELKEMVAEAKAASPDVFRPNYLAVVFHLHAVKTILGNIHEQGSKGGFDG